MNTTRRVFNWRGGAQNLKTSILSVKLLIIIIIYSFCLINFIETLFFIVKTFFLNKIINYFITMKFRRKLISKTLGFEFQQKYRINN